MTDEPDDATLRAIAFETAYLPDALARDAIAKRLSAMGTAPTVAMLDQVWMMRRQAERAWVPEGMPDEHPHRGPKLLSADECGPAPPSISARSD